MIAKCCLTMLDVKWDRVFWSSGCQQIFLKKIYSSIFRNCVAANMCHVLQVDRQLNGTTVMGSFSSYWIKSVSFLLLWLYLYTNKACLKPLGACYHRRRNVFSLYKKREFRLFVGSCNAYDAFVFERPFGRNFFQWKEIKCVNPCKMWSQDLFLTLSDHRDESIRVMGVLGAQGGTVPFPEEFLPCRTWTFLLRFLSSPQVCEVVPKLPRHHCQEITTRGVLCLKE